MVPTSRAECKKGKSKMRLLMIALLIIVPLLSGCGNLQQAGVGGSSSPTASTNTSRIIYRIRFWEWDSLSPALQKEILRVIRGHDDVPGESNWTYSFNPGAVSRDLGDKMVAEWRNGNAKFIGTCVTGVARVPGLLGMQSFSACPGQNPGNERQGAYVQWLSSKSQGLALADPQFTAQISRPNGCQLIYWANPKDGGATGYLSTRGNVSGENEVRRLIASGTPAINLNFVLRCGSGRS